MSQAASHFGDSLVTRVSFPPILPRFEAFSELPITHMYSPKFNLVHDRGILLEAMQAFSFATLFGPAGVDAPNSGLAATHLPLVIRDEGEHGLLEGHFAKANPHWKSLAGRETLVVFTGPHSYVSPTLYTEPLSVPTWNYVAIHAYGTLAPVEDESGKETLLKGLIAAHEPGYLEHWNRLPDGFRRTMLAGIMGFRIPITRIEGKFKLSQNRSAEERSNVHSAQSAGSADEQALARWMERLAGSDVESWRPPALYVDPPGKP
jgi:transcriptional regulator